MKPRVSFTVFGEKSRGGVLEPRSISSPAVALVRTDETSLGVGHHLVEHPLGFALAAAHGAGRVALLPVTGSVPR